jgi:acetylornithine/succinyldiaminopimelate/putrescine aminotransferase
VSTTIRIDGVKETLAELRQVDPKIRKAFTTNAKSIAKPAITVAQNRYRSLQFPSGTYRQWNYGGKEIFPLNSNKAAKSINVKISGAKKKSTAIAIVNSYAGAGVFEFAASGNLGAAFNAKNGPVARVMWPSVTSTENGIEREMAMLVEALQEEINRSLK